MSMLYVDENGAVVGLEGNRFEIKYKDGMRRSVPAETLEGIVILGQAQLTTQCMTACLKRGIPVSFFSKGGVYFGRMMSTGHVRSELQRQQSALYDTEFALELSKKIIGAKLKNQQVVMKRYEKSKNIDTSDCSKMLTICINKCEQIKTISELIGYEGQGAKYYFEGLSRCVEPEFHFHGRSKRPPKDAFNSMLSLGYSILLNELYGAIELKGLNPYFGFLHRDAERHPTLASDMMEEWRAVLVDSVVMSLINGHEIGMDAFVTDLDEPGYFLTKEGLKIFLNKLEKKLQTEVRYLNFVDYAVSFRRAIVLQIEQLVKAIESEDASVYEPVRIR